MTAKLAGGFKGTYAASSGAVTGTLSLQQTTATFYVFGFLPVTAYIGFTQVAPTTGTLTGGKLSTVSTMKVSVPYVSFLGLPFAGGSTCEGSSPITVALTSPGTFSPTAGGTLAGTYTMPPLVNCGLSTGTLNGFVAGPNNTVNVALAP